MHLKQDTYEQVKSENKKLEKELSGQGHSEQVGSEKKSLKREPLEKNASETEQSEKRQFWKGQVRTITILKRKHLEMDNSEKKHLERRIIKR